MSTMYLIEMLGWRESAIAAPSTGGTSPEAVMAHP
jgi:hypothetical protein